jgi:hypothetical protein
VLVLSSQKMPCTKRNMQSHIYFSCSFNSCGNSCFLPVLNLLYSVSLIDKASCTNPVLKKWIHSIQSLLIQLELLIMFLLSILQEKESTTLKSTTWQDGQVIYFVGQDGYYYCEHFRVVYTTVIERWICVASKL